MEKGRIDYLRILVESHHVESIVRCLEGVDLETLTVRTVMESCYRSDRRSGERFYVNALSQLEIFAGPECREIILERLAGYRKTIEGEITRQNVHIRSRDNVTGASGPLFRLGLEIRHPQNEFLT